MSSAGKKVKLFYRLFLLFLFTCLLCTGMGCSRGNRDQSPITPNTGVEFFKDEALHCVLYVNPDTDCQVCYMNALDMLEKIRRQESINTPAIDIIALKSESSGYFVDSAKKKYRNVNIILVSRPLPFPHPSVLVFKKSHILLYVYLSVNPYIMKDTLDKMTAIVNNFSF